MSHQIKKIIFAIVISISSIVGFGGNSEINTMSYGLPDSADHYYPHVYRNYTDGIVYTEQLKMLEYQIQRLDWLHTNIDTIKNSISVCMICLVVLCLFCLIQVNYLKALHKVETKHKQHFDKYAEWMSDTMNTINSNIIKT